MTLSNSCLRNRVISEAIYQLGFSETAKLLSIGNLALMSLYAGKEQPSPAQILLLEEKLNVQ
jgi:hypothetical protein